MKTARLFESLFQSSALPQRKRAADGRRCVQIQLYRSLMKMKWLLLKHSFL